MRSCTPPSRENFGSVVPAAPKPFAHNGLAWNQTFVPGWFQAGSRSGSRRRFRAAFGRKPPGNRRRRCLHALPSRLVGTLSACLPAFLLCLPAWLSCLAPATRQQAARQPATHCLAGRKRYRTELRADGAARRIDAGHGRLPACTASYGRGRP